MNPNELKMISNYMELKELELSGLAMVPEEFLDNAFFSFPKLAISLSNGEIVTTIDVEIAKDADEMEYIKNNFKTVMTFEKQKYIIIKLF